MKYLVRYQLTPGHDGKETELRECVTDDVPEPYDAMSYVWDMYSDFPLYYPTVEILAIYELHEVPAPDWQGDSAEFDTSCEVCGAPDRWPLCAECERREYNNEGPYGW